MTSSDDAASDRPRLAAESQAAIDEEHRGWDELASLVGALTPEERLAVGYQRSPDWSVLDLVGHVGSWLAEAHLQLQRLGAGTYDRHEVDIDAINAQLLDAMQGQTWAVTWTQANAARTMLLQQIRALREVDADARWWIRKAGPEHYVEHLPRLRTWVGELLAGRMDQLRPAP